MSDVIYWHAHELERLTGMSENVWTWMTCFVGSFLINLGLSQINGPTARKTYSTFFGLVLGFYFNGSSYLLIILNFVCVYLIMLLPWLTRKQKSWTANTFCFTFLLALHYKYWIDSRIDYDISTHCMTIYAKTHMTFCSYTDALTLIDRETKDDGESRELGFIPYD